MSCPVVIQAAMASARFPGKVLAPLNNRPLLEHVIHRARRATRVSAVYVTVPGEPQDLPLLHLLEELEDLGDIAGIFRGFGDKRLTLLQWICALRDLPDPAVVRLTADNPLIDPAVIDQAIAEMERGDWDIVASRSDLFPHARWYPPGYDVEVVRRRALLDLFVQEPLTLRPAAVEHVTPLLYQQGSVCWVAPPGPVPPGLQVTVDTPSDLARVAQIMTECGDDVDLAGVVAWWKKMAPCA